MLSQAKRSLKECDRVGISDQAEFVLMASIASFYMKEVKQEQVNELRKKFVDKMFLTPVEHENQIVLRS